MVTLCRIARVGNKRSGPTVDLQFISGVTSKHIAFLRIHVQLLDEATITNSSFDMIDSEQFMFGREGKLGLLFVSHEATITNSSFDMIDSEQFMFGREGKLGLLFISHFTSVTEENIFKKYQL